MLVTAVVGKMRDADLLLAGYGGGLSSKDGSSKVEEGTHV